MGVVIHLGALCDAEIADANGDLSTGQDLGEQVRWLDVAVDDSVLVSGRDPPSRLVTDLRRHPRSERTVPLEQPSHVTPNEERHDEVEQTRRRILPIASDWDDVAAPDARSDRSLSEMVGDFPQYVSTPEIRIDVTEEQKWTVVEAAVAHFSSLHDVIDVDGVRVLFGDGWALLRASNTQPVIVARYEARTEDRLGEIRDEVESWLRAQGVTP